MNNTLVSIFNFIDRYNMIDPKDKIVVGLSGGADSVCLLLSLCEYCKANGMPIESITAVHVHHMIRGAEADGDMEFAKNLCEELGVSFHSFKKDIRAYAKENNMSDEEAGRVFRYECFDNVCKQYGLNKIAVAHNKNDQAETVIFNMVRGTGLKGMSGIMPVRDNIIRPLLNTTRAEIEAYLTACGKKYRTDSTNNELDYDRNKIRHVVIPALLSINKEAVSHICQAAMEASVSYDYIHDVALSDYTHLDDTASQTVLNINDMFKLSPVLQEHMVHEAIGDVAGIKKDITRKHVMSVVNLIYSDTGKSVNLPYGIIARRSYDELIIEKEQKDFCDSYDIALATDGEYQIPYWGILRISSLENTKEVLIPKKIYTKMIDCDKIEGTLCVRTPREGDYITIDAKGNTKKLNRVFIDNKIDREKRKNWPVVAIGSHVVWAIGLRYNEAYKIDENTKSILCLTFDEGEGE